MPTQHAGFMRSRRNAYLFALESAMTTQLCLDIDPVRCARSTTPCMSRSRLPSPAARWCMFRCRAQAFEWSRRDPKPRSMRDGDGWSDWAPPPHVSSNIAACAARVTLSDGTARCRWRRMKSAKRLYVCAVIAADKLGLAPEQIKVELGDSKLPPAPWQRLQSTASVAMRAKPVPRSGQAGQGANGTIEAYVENLPEGVPPGAHEICRKAIPPLCGRGQQEEYPLCLRAQFVKCGCTG